MAIYILKETMSAFSCLDVESLVTLDCHIIIIIIVFLQLTNKSVLGVFALKKCFVFSPVRRRP